MIEANISSAVVSAPWFVIWTQSRAEKKVEARLTALGLHAWLPTVTERHRWSDRWKNVVRPLFPGYLFARATSVEWHKVLTIPGVLTIVKHAGEPALLAPEFVAQLKSAITSEGAAPEQVPEDDYVVGDEVIVQEGSFRGLRGIIRERRNRRQLVIWVAEIGRGVAITIGSTLVRAAS